MGPYQMTTCNKGEVELLGLVESDTCCFLSLIMKIQKLPTNVAKLTLFTVKSNYV